MLQKTRALRCPICRKGFSTKIGLNYHKVEKHIEDDNDPLLITTTSLDNLGIMISDSKNIEEFIFNLKYNTPCKDCGVSYLPQVMDFDHIQSRGKKEFTISKFVQNNGTSKLGTPIFNTLLLEINKCDIVCSNCHRLRTMGRSIKNDVEIE